MAGKTGCVHKCEGNRLNPNGYAISLRDSSFSEHECNIIWDFYVSHAISDKNTIDNLLAYGWSITNSKTDGYPALEKSLANAAGLAEFHLIRSTDIKDTLSAMSLTGTMVCIDHPRAVMKRNASTKVNENETLEFTESEGRVLCIMRHVRNSLAHNNTYFFQNDMLMLEDKEKTKITARILMEKKALLDWIKIIDKNNIRMYDWDN